MLQLIKKQKLTKFSDLDRYSMFVFLTETPDNLYQKIEPNNLKNTLCLNCSTGEMDLIITPDTYSVIPVSVKKLEIEVEEI